MGYFDVMGAASISDPLYVHTVAAHGGQVACNIELANHVLSKWKEILFTESEADGKSGPGKDLASRERKDLIEVSVFRLGLFRSAVWSCCVIMSHVSTTVLC